MNERQWIYSPTYFIPSKGGGRIRGDGSVMMVPVVEGMLEREGRGGGGGGCGVHLFKEHPQN